MVVLLLDDDKELLQLLPDAVAAEGYDVIPVERGQEAIRLVRDKAPVDLLLLDIGQPHKLVELDKLLAIFRLHHPPGERSPSFPR